MTSIISFAETPPTLGNNAFNYVDKSIPVQIPCGSLQDYHNTSGWNDFTNYVTPCAPTGGVNSRFSIGNTTQVYFSQGNLQFQASTNTWRFAENQWDAIGEDNANISDSYDGWIDLFGWGTGDDPNPTQCTAFNSDYESFVDWGSNPISNGGNTANLWRTLTDDEWDYLLFSRVTISGVRYAKATVNGVAGLIILPDDWSSSYYTLNNANGGAYENNTISLTTWESVFEAHGAVFLPAAGIRGGTTVYYAGMDGFYWSSTSENSESANCFEFSESFFGLIGNERYCGQSVRLVASAPTVYAVNATSSPEEGGLVTGEGVYEFGHTCTLTASPNAGYTFVKWSENAIEVSAEASYSFVVLGNRNLVANYQGQSIPIGAINGKFSIDDSTQVFFSRGNLQFIGSAEIPYWKFADNQWDYLGTTTGQGSADQNVDRDLFGWGTSGFNHGANCYQPWSTNSSHSNYYAYGSDTCNLFDQTGWADWGCNVIINGGNQLNYGWRTLTHEEWLYLFNNRSTPSGIRYAKAKVNDVCCVILLPDDWNADYYSLNQTNNTSANFSSNIITASQWAVLEEHGAVLLPEAGYRSGTTVKYAGSEGYYWSSSYKSTVYAWNVDLRSSSLNAGGTYYRYFGHSVRLVCNVPVPCSINATTNPAEGGTVNGAGTYNHFETCTLTATANEGYTFLNWTHDGEVVSTNAAYSFTVTGPATYTANFELNSYEITATANPEAGGTITGAGTYDHGASCTLTATAAEGYTFLNWTHDGEVVSTSAAYSFTVTGPASYTANFELNSYEITAMANPEAGGTITGAGMYNHLGTCTLTATANEGYMFVNWTENGVVVSTDASYSFTVTEVASFVANFDFVHSQPLSFGWNWWSTYIEMEGVDGLEMLKNNLGNSCVRIQSRSQYLDNYTDFWYGTLTEITNEQSYRIRTNTECDAALIGTLANPEDHPITISNGWNWVGFPSSQNVSLSVALSGFSPEVNDQVKGRHYYATYIGNDLWYGTLNTLESGQGYMYLSNSNETKTLTYQTGRNGCFVGNITTERNHFTPSCENYADNLTITAVIEPDGAELYSNEYELAAFVDDECRGSVKLMYVEPIDRYVAFLLVYGDAEEDMHFVLTDGLETILSDDVFNFVADKTIGTITHPAIIHFGTLGVDGNQREYINVFPNPSKGIFNIEGNEIIKKVEVINAFGQTILSEEAGNNHIQIDLKDKAAGIYLLRVFTNNGNNTIQIIKE